MCDETKPDPAPPMRRAGLLLVGHGSTTDAERASAALRRHARRIETGGLVQEVRVGLLKGDRPLVEILAAMQSADVVVVPVLASDGWFARRMLPRALGLRGERAHLPAKLGGHRVVCADPVGTRPELARIVLENATGALAGASLSPSSASLIVVGHGTSRDPSSGSSVRTVVASLGVSGPFQRVVAGFIDATPNVAAALHALPAGPVVAVPFLMAEAGHSLDDLPRALGLPACPGPGARQVGDHEVVYSDVVGAHPGIAEVILTCAAEAAARL